jgi:hypothetical protein
LIVKKLKMSWCSRKRRFPGHARPNVEQAQLSRKMGGVAVVFATQNVDFDPGPSACIGRLARLLAGSIRPQPGN